jgi:hypothetical protein
METTEAVPLRSHLDVPPLQKEIESLQNELDLLHRIPNPNRDLLKRIDFLEARLVAAFVTCEQVSNKMSFAQAVETVAHLDEIDFLDYLMRFHPRDRVGHANHKRACVIHRYICHQTGLRADWFLCCIRTCGSVTVRNGTNLRCRNGRPLSPSEPASAGTGTPAREFGRRVCGGCCPKRRNDLEEPRSICSRKYNDSYAAASWPWRNKNIAWAGAHGLGASGFLHIWCASGEVNTFPPGLLQPRAPARAHVPKLSTETPDITAGSQRDAVPETLADRRSASSPNFSTISLVLLLPAGTH